MINEILNDLEQKLNIKIDINKINYFYDGHTNSKVFSIDNKYIVKTFNRKSLNNQLLFYNEYQNIDIYPKIICFNNKLKYICFSYIKGQKFNELNLNYKDVIKQIYNIINNYHEYKGHFYGYLDNKKLSWYNFLKYEIKHANKVLNKQILLNKVLTSLKIIKNYNIKKYLIHGDLGTHNFIINNNTIYIIDTMPIIGDKLYDFYFAILSNNTLFDELNITDIFQYYDYSIEYKKALFTIILFIIMGRLSIYNRDKLSIYIDLYNKL